MSKRWRDAGSDARDLERAVLRTGLGGDPPDSARDEVWRRLLPLLPLPPAGGSGGEAAAPAPHAAPHVAHVAAGKGAVALAVAQGFGAGLLVMGALAAGQHVTARAPAASASPVALPAASRGSSAPAHAAELGSAKHEPSAAPAGAQESAASARSGARVDNEPPLGGELEPVQSVPASASVASFPSDAAAAPRTASALAAEAALLRTARGELERGELAAASRSLQALEREFPSAQLLQEREALAIELCYRSGQRGLASERARAFLGKFPSSPHAAQVRQWLGVNGGRP